MGFSNNYTKVPALYFIVFFLLQTRVNLFNENSLKVQRCDARMHFRTVRPLEQIPVLSER